MGRDRRGDALDDRLAEGTQHPSPSRLAVLSPHDDLRHQVVVELADGVTRLVARVSPGAETVRRAKTGEAPGTRQEAPTGRVLRVDPALDRVPAPPCRELVLGEPERLTCRHAQLQSHEIDPGHELGHRVLDL